MALQLHHRAPVPIAIPQRAGRPSRVDTPEVVSNGGGGSQTSSQVPSQSTTSNVTPSSSAAPRIGAANRCSSAASVSFNQPQHLFGSPGISCVVSADFPRSVDGTDIFVSTSSSVSEGEGSIFQLVFLSSLLVISLLFFL